MYSTIDNITTSLKLAWKHKIIWIFALMVGIGGIGMNFLNFLESDEPNEKIPSDSRAYVGSYYVPASKFHFNENIMGVASQRYAPKLPIDDIGHIVSLIFILIVPFLIFTIYLLIARFISLCWSQASLVDATVKIVSHNNILLPQISKTGLDNLNHFFILNVYKSLAAISFGIIFGAYAVVYKFLNTFVLSLLLIPTIILFVVAVGVFTVSFAFASRYIILYKDSPLDALKKGVSLFKNNFNLSMKLLLGNYFVSIVIIMGIMGISFPLFFILTVIIISAGFSLDNLAMLAPFMVALILPFSIIFGVVAQAVVGYIISFYEFSCTRLFFHLTQGLSSTEVQNAAGQ